jgi:hypothetical protein
MEVNHTLVLFTANVPLNSSHRTAICASRLFSNVSYHFPNMNRNTQKE